jgi:hypothetical protein
METIEIKTLIDITNTDVRRINQGSQLELDQFRNWTTLQQCIGLRAIIAYDRDPASEIVDLKDSEFGADYKGKHRVWTFQFRPDRPDAFADGNDHIALLREDLDLIPIIINLTETINTQQAVFNLNDKKFKNTLIKAL